MKRLLWLSKSEDKYFNVVVVVALSSVVVVSQSIHIPLLVSFVAGEHKQSRKRTVHILLC